MRFQKELFRKAQLNGISSNELKFLTCLNQKEKVTLISFFSFFFSHMLSGDIQHSNSIFSPFFFVSLTCSYPKFISHISIIIQTSRDLFQMLIYFEKHLKFQKYQTASPYKISSWDVVLDKSILRTTCLQVKETPNTPTELNPEEKVAY